MTHHKAYVNIIVLLALTTGTVHSQGFLQNMRNLLFGGSKRSPQPQFNQPVGNQLNPQTPSQFNQQQQTQPQFSQQGQPQIGQQQAQRPFSPQQANGAGGAVHGCKLAAPNHIYENGNYLITWLINGDGKQDKEFDACQNFTAQDAESYCQAVGGHAISLDTNPRAEHFMDQARVYGKRYFWTGGRIDISQGVINWPSGAREGVGTHGTRYWSHTGRNNSPQPDNRDGDEFCLAVLNNFYADGIKWHDVSCHHRKPTICEIQTTRFF